MSKGLLFRTVLILLLAVSNTHYGTIFANNDFYNDRYRGWYWFDERKKEEETNKERLTEKEKLPTQEEYANARKEVENFASELEDLKYMMIRYPDNLDHIKRYKEKEAIVLDNAVLLSKNYQMVNFLNPHLDDELEYSSNLYGRKIQQEIQKRDQIKELKEVASKVELYLFFSSTCPYCKTLEKSLVSFAKEYGFTVSAISSDNSKSEYFNSYYSPEVIAKLNLNIMPTVIAVTNDSSVRFEIARGAVSISELEEKALLMARRMKELEEEYKESEGKSWQKYSKSTGGVDRWQAVRE